MRQQGYRFSLETLPEAAAEEEPARQQLNSLV
jgi:hypothetical protein